MDSQEKVTFKIFINIVREHPLAVIGTLAAGCIGAFLGVMLIIIVG